jgi:hypothetical protein
VILIFNGLSCAFMNIVNERKASEYNLPKANCVNEKNIHSIYRGEFVRPIGNKRIQYIAVDIQKTVFEAKTFMTYSFCLKRVI